ncbi:DNA-methyltransferase [Candidatus Harpocratesius sp.]
MGRKKYIPHLAEFYFKPEFNWDHEDCYRLFSENVKPYYDSIQYQDCIQGMKDMDPNSVNLIIADPPFGINFTGKEAIYNRKAKNVVDGYVEISDYPSFSEAWIRELPRIMKPDASAFIISGWTNLEYILKAIREANLHLINHIIWKYQFGPFASRKFVSSHYHIIWVVKNPKKYFFHRIEHYNLDVWDEIPRTYKMEQKKNGTKLPEELVKRMIDFTTRPGDLVFDPFMGNGTTAIAAKLNYRHYFGFEMNPKMQQIIDSNLANCELGADYIPYRERIKTPEELAKDLDPSYRKAYEIYLKREKLKSKSS